MQFGSVNVKTGENQDGYIDSQGAMKFKKQPFWKRWFKKEPIQVETIGSIICEYSWIWSHKTHSEVEVAVYRRYNPFTNKTKDIFCNTEIGCIYFNIDFWDKERRLVRI